MLFLKNFGKPSLMNRSSPLSRIFSVEKLENGNFEFREECDRYFSAELTKEETQKLIEELQALISQY
jgi:hypothetical protein